MNTPQQNSITFPIDLSNEKSLNERIKLKLNKINSVIEPKLTS